MSFQKSPYVIYIHAAAESLHKGIYIDPCTPKGYLPGSGSWKFSPGSSDEKNKYISNLQAGGNFSECRSAALMMLQKGNGNTILQALTLSLTCLFWEFISIFFEENDKWYFCLIFR